MFSPRGSGGFLAGGGSLERTEAVPVAGGGAAISPRRQRTIVSRWSVRSTSIRRNKRGGRARGRSGGGERRRSREERISISTRKTQNAGELFFVAMQSWPSYWPSNYGRYVYRPTRTQSHGAALRPQGTGRNTESRNHYSKRSKRQNQKPPSTHNVFTQLIS